MLPKTPKHLQARAHTTLQRRAAQPELGVDRASRHVHFNTGVETRESDFQRERKKRLNTKRKTDCTPWRKRGKETAMDTLEQELGYRG